MDFFINHYFLRQRQLLELAEEKILSSNPSHILRKGFAMVEDKDGSVISTIKQVQLNQDISVHVSDGVISADVTRIKEKE